MDILEGMLSAFGIKKKEIKSPLPEVDTLNDPAKLDYVNRNMVGQENASRMRNEPDTLNKGLIYPDWMANSPQMADGSQAVLGTQAQQPKSTVMADNSAATREEAVKNFISRVRRERPNFKGDDATLARLYDKYGEDKLLGGGVQAQTVPTPTPTPAPTAGAFSARNPNSVKFNPAPEVVSAIQNAAKTYGMTPDILFDIGIQESGLNPGSENKTPDGVAAGNPKGLFQFTDGTWETVKKYAAMQGSTLKLPNDNRLDPNTNALAAAYLIANGQLGRWDASKNVWGQYYDEEELTPYYAQTLSRKKG